MKRSQPKFLPPNWIAKNAKSSKLSVWIDATWKKNPKRSPQSALKACTKREGFPKQVRSVEYSRLRNCYRRYKKTFCMKRCFLPVILYSSCIRTKTISTKTLARILLHRTSMSGSKQAFFPPEDNGSPFAAGSGDFAPNNAKQRNCCLLFRHRCSCDVAKTRTWQLLRSRWEEQTIGRMFYDVLLALASWTLAMGSLL